MTQRELTQAAKRLARALKSRNVRVVFAESCTAGLVAATLARVPGISEYLCGSAVTYRNNTKHRWLGVSETSLHKPGPVSTTVARQMARGVLSETPEADFSAAITGHLGPDAPPDLDGLVHVAVSERTSGRKRPVRTHDFQQVLEPIGRLKRQRAAAGFVLESLERVLWHGNCETP